ncbi:Basic leucine zipper 34 [Vitis vinifera]|uniref:Basic leucine zipper 34 n=1 Tax=Vitis vinifera TaxID=29760 RepID=A0A438GVP9_VITVI|nr:Basic leucine zipper 34 [Vitis vinifera]
MLFLLQWMRDMNLQFAQRSRVRKLQYIAELERNVQALKAKGSEVSAELDFLNQQNLILSMENKALKQRLEFSTGAALLSTELSRWEIVCEDESVT